MSAIPAASVSLKTMADGTLRFTFDIEPAQAQDAFRLFAAPGTPVAIAALQVGYAAAKEPEPPKEPIGPLCKWLVMRCAEQEFWTFLNKEKGGPAINKQSEAEHFVKHILGVTTRKEVDTDKGKTFLLDTVLRHPYQRWLVRRGLA